VKAPAKTFNSKQLIAGTVQVKPTPDGTEFVGNCPTCSSRLTVQVRGDGSHGNLVACMRCKQIYRIETEAAPAPQDNQPRGFGVSYTVAGEWDTSSIMEYLFDNIGSVNSVVGGFVCQPDEYHADFPTITVNERTRTVRFGLFGHYPERDAGAIINQVVSEFGSKFQLDLHPLLLERWEYRDEAKGYTLVERRPLGTLLRERPGRKARA
jgi:DNA-directed RNA polymerase subunit RPC12/RpoP